MKKSILMVCMLGVVFASCNLATASIPVLWQADVNHPSQAAISRIKLTPDNGNLMVFGSSPSHGSPIIVDKFNASNGSSIWSKPLSKSGKRLAYGWVDSADNLYVLSVWSGYTLWKYDSELVTELWSYTDPNSSFEYVMNIITDELNNVYATGFFGSGSGAGSTLVKLDQNGILAWPSPYTYTATSGKDNYGGGIALDSNKNVFRGGTDDEVYDSQRGRLLGHDANDGTVFLDVSVDETNSDVYGVIVDKNDNIIIGYTYNLLNPDRTPTNLERTVVQGFNQSGASLWKYTFPDIGMFMCNRNCVVKRNDNSFYVAYNLRKDGTVYPGVAEFDIDGNLIWRDTLNEPGWTIPCIDAPANKDLIYVGLMQADGASVIRVLCITPSPVILSPNGGENLVGGNKYTITWDSPNDPNIDFVLIEYSTNNGQDWNDVDMWWNTGSYEWDPVPAVDSNQCLVRISDLFDPDVSDTSDDVFAIFQCIVPISGDLNGDCYVDFRDFAIFARDWLKCGNPFDDCCYRWLAYNGHHYAVTRTYSNWADAEGEAVAVRGHLVTVNDDNENTWLTNNFGGYYTYEERETHYPWSSLIWIGLEYIGGDMTDPNSWQWVSGEPRTYMAPWWDPDLPSGTHAYLHPSTHPNPGTWWNSPGHDTDPNEYPRGIIEVPW